MERNLTNQTLALAGLMQALHQVQSVAHEGRADPEILETAVHSLFATDPEDVDSVYGGFGRLRKGLALLHSQLQAASGERDVERTRYLVTLLHLERKLSGNRDLLQRVGDGLDRARQQAGHFDDATHEAVLGGLGQTYRETISTLRPRILVAGEPEYLENPGNADKVRTLLLAAVRSAVLWRQAGGGRLRLLLKRKAVAREAKRLLARLGEADVPVA